MESEQAGCEQHFRGSDIGRSARQDQTQTSADEGAEANPVEEIRPWWRWLPSRRWSSKKLLPDHGSAQEPADSALGPLAATTAATATATVTISWRSPQPPRSSGNPSGVGRRAGSGTGQPPGVLGDLMAAKKAAGDRKADTPADLLLSMLSDMLLGRTPDMDDVALAHAVLLRHEDPYQPLNLRNQMQQANLSADVVHALMHQLGAGGDTVAPEPPKASGQQPQQPPPKPTGVDEQEPTQTPQPGARSSPSDALPEVRRSPQDNPPSCQTAAPIALGPRPSTEDGGRNGVRDGVTSAGGDGGEDGPAPQQSLLLPGAPPPTPLESPTEGKREEAAEELSLRDALEMLLAMPTPVSSPAPRTRAPLTAPPRQPQSLQSPYTPPPKAERRGRAGAVAREGAVGGAGRVEDGGSTIRTAQEDGEGPRAAATAEEEENKVRRAENSDSGSDCGVRRLGGGAPPCLGGGGGEGGPGAVDAACPVPSVAPPLMEEIDRALALVDCWQYDTFRLHEATGGHSLSALGFFLMHREGLVAHWGIGPTKLARLLRTLEAGYGSSPYHNSVHAADVLQTFHVLLWGSGLAGAGAGQGGYLDPLGRLAAYFAAIIHDLGHPGLTADFLVATSDPLAVRYNDRSPLENHHGAAFFDTLRRGGHLDVLGHLGAQERTAFRKLVLDLVLSTDMKQHFSLLAHFNAAHRLAPYDKDAGPWERAGRRQPGSGGSRVGSESRCGSLHGPPAASFPADLEPPRPLDETERVLSLQIALKVADLGHLGERLDVHKRWVSSLESEFFLQGDREAALGLPVSPLFDRRRQGVSKSQVGFFDFVALPLAAAVAAAFPGARPLLGCFVDNYEHWRGVEREERERAEREAAAAGNSASQTVAAAPA